jgi:hypothetical protein
MHTTASNNNACPATQGQYLAAHPSLTHEAALLRAGYEPCGLQHGPDARAHYVEPITGDARSLPLGDA